MKTDFKTMQEVLSFLGIFENHCKNIKNISFDFIPTRKLLDNRIECINEMKGFIKFVYIDEKASGGSSDEGESCEDVSTNPEFKGGWVYPDANSNGPKGLADVIHGE